MLEMTEIIILRSAASTGAWVEIHPRSPLRDSSSRAA